jgi:hypothetical protein
MSRKPWQIPIEYVDLRFLDEDDPVPPPDGATPTLPEPDDFDEGDDTPEVEFAFESTDTDPLDYDNGPHDELLGVDDDAFDSNDVEPIDYSRGPHDDESGIDDEDDDPE